MLPDVGSFYAKVQRPSRQRVYGPRTVRFMLARMVSPIFIFIFLLFYAFRNDSHDLLIGYSTHLEFDWAL